MDIIILTLATWCISSLLVNEDGPFDMFSWLRFWLGVRYTERNEAYGTNMVSEILTCLLCTSVWVGIILTIGYVIVPVYITWFCLPFALSAGAIIANEGVTWLQSNR